MSEMLDAAVQAALRKPFPASEISKLPATAKRPALDYVSHAAVTNRLIDAAPGWTYTVEPVVVHGGIEDGKFVTNDFGGGLPHVVAVFGSMTIGGVTRQEVGAVDSFSSYGQELKEAISDFIRRGAMRFGVALDLWAKEDLTSEPTATRTSHLGGGSDNAGTGATHGSPPASVPAPSAGPNPALVPAAGPAPSSAGEAGTAPAEAPGTEAEVAGEGIGASVPATPVRPKDCKHLRYEDAPRAGWELCTVCGNARKKKAA